MNLMKLMIIITIVISVSLIPLLFITHAIAERIDDHIHIVTQFSHAVEGSITEFNNSIVLLMLGFMVSVSEQNQVNTENDYIPLTTEFIYNVSGTTNTSSTHNSNLNLHIASNIQLQKQVMTNKHTTLNIQSDINLYVGGDEG